MQFNQSVNITYTGRKIFIVKPRNQYTVHLILLNNLC